MTRFVYDDGGRAAAGFRGTTGDCATRAAAIATGLPYREVYDAINQAAKAERPRRGRRSNARTGVHGRTLRRYLESLGWTWTPTMAIGSGTTTHLRADELPGGRLLVFCSRHFVAVLDGVIHDLDPDVDRGGTRCVYSYLQPPREDTP